MDKSMSKGIIVLVLFLFVISALVVAVPQLNYVFNPYTSRQDAVLSLNQTNENITVDRLCFNANCSVYIDYNGSSLIEKVT